MVVALKKKKLGSGSSQADGSCLPRPRTGITAEPAGRRADGARGFERGAGILCSPSPAVALPARTRPVRLVTRRNEGTQN